MRHDAEIDMADAKQCDAAILTAANHRASRGDFGDLSAAWVLTLLPVFFTLIMINTGRSVSRAIGGLACEW
jgi:hypothetical protein